MPFAPSDERERICPSHPEGIATANPVLILELSPRITSVSSRARKSHPAASKVPWVGACASSWMRANLTSTSSRDTTSPCRTLLQTLWLNKGIFLSNLFAFFFNFQSSQIKTSSIRSSEADLREPLCKNPRKGDNDRDVYTLQRRAEKFHKGRIRE